MLYHLISALLILSNLPDTSQYGTLYPSSSNREYLNYEQLYRIGVDAYLENNFQDCVKYIEEALREYKDYNRIVNSCRLGCKQKDYPPIVPNQDPYFKHYEALIQETLCLMNCKRGKVNPNRIEQIEDYKLVKDFETLKTYDYLQLCYFQTEEPVKAAHAAYTNLLANPDHVIMKENLNYFVTLTEMDRNNLVDLEQPEFYKSYLTARQLYSNDKYREMIPHMEKALEIYFQEENICRVHCEKPFDMGWFPDFVSSVSNHFVFCLKCKLNCATTLHTASGIMDEELVYSMFDYLQFAYFKVENFEQALSNALTFIRLRGKDRVMENNVNYYRALLDGADGEIRKDALKYIEREEDELALLNFIEEKFNFPSRVEDEENPAGQTAQVEETFTHNEDTVIDNNADIPSPYLAYEEAAVETKGDNAMLSPPPVVTFQP